MNHARSQNERIATRLGRALRELDKEFATTSERVRKRADGEALHDMRVSIRKIRVLLKIGRSVYGRFLADSVRNEFTVLHRSTGALRDEEVLEETLGAIEIDAADFIQWREKRTARRKMLYAQVVKLASPQRIQKARALLLALLVLPVKRDRNPGVSKFAKGARLRARQVVEKRSNAAVDDVDALHALRIAEKGLRYAIDPFVDVLPESASAEEEHAAKCQKRLGEIHDLDVARLVVERARTLSPATRSAVLQQLAERRSETVQKWLTLGAIQPITTENDGTLSPEGSAPATLDGKASPLAPS